MLLIKYINYISTFFQVLNVVESSPQAVEMYQALIFQACTRIIQNAPG